MFDAPVHVFSGLGDRAHVTYSGQAWAAPGNSGGRGKSGNSNGGGNSGNGGGNGRGNGGDRGNSSNAGNGGGSGGNSGNSGGDGGNSGNAGSSGGSSDSSGGGNDNSAGPGRGAFRQLLDVIQNRGGNLRLRYENGWDERIRDGRYRLVDPQGRTVTDRPATSADMKRMREIADQ